MGEGGREVIEQNSFKTNTNTLSAQNFISKINAKNQKQQKEKEIKEKHRMNRGPGNERIEEQKRNTEMALKLNGESTK